jgi:multidrug efflux pump subunit AcrA (membrane-fusion protein)
MTAGVAVLSACSHGSAQQGQPPAAVEIAPATRGNIATYVVLDGQVAPQFDATLATAEAGTVSAVYVNEGDHVRKGELLVKLDDSQLQAQLIQAKGLVAQAEATLSSQRIQDPTSRRKPTRSSSTIRTSSSSNKASSRRRLRCRPTPRTSPRSRRR